ncbi:hypothetical protein GTGU_03582 [Trabulsiella guamensis ATCC 49490]|uniref:Uncharacterized protein n=1 Tax=Trabulsiella guamensis ATCC 49490 TaxID=1005994 RepID=A0A084ZUC0_9ENTR|nr:hypothetical protein [Trabulsiella guamensis]KFC01065.1 hypothetical protein GTGU_03582 [Trabulsiella guamensis ATCC 49490]
MSNTLFEGTYQPFRIWSIFSIARFEFEKKTIDFPMTHRVVFAYLASLANRYGDISVSYLSVCKKTGVTDVEEMAEIFGWLMAFNLLSYVPTSLFDGERVKFKYRVNYPENIFPHKIIHTPLEH